MASAWQAVDNDDDTVSFAVTVMREIRLLMKK